MNSLNRKIARGILFAFVLFGISACASPPPKIFDKPQSNVPLNDKKLFEKAMKEQDRGQYDKAIGLWKEFLKRQPNSYAAHNNLGMVFYTEDRLSESIAEFEKALQLMSMNDMIRKNLSRSLQFQVALLKENREYDRAISNLKRLQEISKPEDYQKIQFMIEQTEDQIYQQVEEANTAEDYRQFIEKYPEGVNADKARKKLADMEKRSSQVRPFEDLELLQPEGGVLMDETPTEGLSPIAEDTMKEADMMDLPASGMMPAETEPVPMIEDSFTEESVADVKTMDPASTVTEAQEAMENVPATVNEMEAKAVPEMKTPEIEAPSEVIPVPEIETPPAVAEKPEVVEAPPLDLGKVQVRLNKSPTLRVRSEPSLKGKIVFRLKNGAVVPLVEEQAQWFKVEFESGKTGWISRKFSKKVDPRTQQILPEVRKLRAAQFFLSEAKKTHELTTF